MRGTVVKRLRRQIYGLQSHRIKRRYLKLSNGAIVNTGLRAAYRRAKKEYRLQMGATGK